MLASSRRSFGGVYEKSRGNGMRRLAIRLLWGAALLVVISILSFALAELAPGDFLSELKLNPRISQETRDALRLRYGLDDSLAQRYLSWVGSVVEGDLGYSFAYAMPVGRLLAPRLRNTLVLTILAMIVAWWVAVPVGAWMAWRPGGWVDRAGTGVVAVLLAVPELLLGLAFVMLAVSTSAFPTGGMTSVGFAELSFWARARDLAWHLVLPVTALALSSTPVILRHARSAFAEVFAAPYLRAARGYGIPTRRLLIAYGLPAAANPLISLFGLSLATLVSGSFLIEVVLGWPGVGPLLIEAILARDLHLVVGAILVSAVFVIAGQFLADVLLYVVDPRTREAS
jgi:peptide/nickel transport system permease protein